MQQPPLLSGGICGPGEAVATTTALSAKQAQQSTGASNAIGNSRYSS